MTFEEACAAPRTPGLPGAGTGQISAPSALDPVRQEAGVVWRGWGLVLIWICCIVVPSTGSSAFSPAVSSVSMRAGPGLAYRLGSAITGARRRMTAAAMPVALDV